MIRTDARVIVVACGSAKADQERPAAELYTGSLFRAARRAAQADGRGWLICSAEHGLIHPTQVLAPYERALTDTPADMARVGELIAGRHHLLAREGGAREPGVEVWAPARYVRALRAGGVDVRLTPLAGLGIGAQIGWLTRQATSCEDYYQHTGQRPGPLAAGRWLVRDEGRVYSGSLTAHHGQPVVGISDGRWVDNGDLLGVQYLNLTLANGVQLSNVHPDHLTRTPTEGDPSTPRMARTPALAAAPATAPTTPTAARGRSTR